MPSIQTTIRSADQAESHSDAELILNLERLLQLLKEPEPGLWTWMTARNVVAGRLLTELAYRLSVSLPEAK